jgi:hypothetical protein
VLGKNGFTCVKHYAHKINGQKHGFSGFWKNNETGYFVYVSTDFMPDSYGNTLVRCAKDENDFCGGQNNWTHNKAELLQIAKAVTQVW